MANTWHREAMLTLAATPAPTSSNSKIICMPTAQPRILSKLSWQGSSVLGAQQLFKNVAVTCSTPEIKGVSGVLTGQDMIQSTRLPQIQVDAVAFKARRSVKIPVKEGAFAAKDYLRQLERVVNVTFPDSARITYVGDSTWRTLLKPVTFFTISATPVCDVQVYNKGETLQIRSDRLFLELSGLPEDFINRSIQFRLRGQLYIDAEVGSRYKAGRDVDFSGVVNLGLTVNLPPPLAIIPEPLVTAVGDRILDAILGNMQSALLTGIVPDYHAWCQMEEKTLKSNSAAVGVTRSI